MQMRQRDCLVNRKQCKIEDGLDQRECNTQKCTNNFQFAVPYWSGWNEWTECRLELLADNYTLHACQLGKVSIVRASNLIESELNKIRFWISSKKYKRKRRLTVSSWQGASKFFDNHLIGKLTGNLMWFQHTNCQNCINIQHMHPALEGWPR